MGPIAIAENKHEVDVSHVAEQKAKELFQGKAVHDVDFQTFFGYQPNLVNRNFSLSLSDLSYLPKIDNPRADWVVNAALNAFKAFQQGGLGEVRRFATVGTGSGTDAVVALDIFPNLQNVAMTDLHTDVVQTAKRNVLSATEGSGAHIDKVAGDIVAEAGDCLLPLKGQAPYDLIYENLPNIPLSSSGDLNFGQTSSTYIGDRTADKVPIEASAALLDLHYVCLRQARELGLVRSGSTIISSMGGRVPVASMLSVASAAGYTGRILTISWKVQSEPEAVIGGYADSQRAGFGPFFFYTTAALRRVLHGWKPAAAALCAEQIEAELLPERLDAITALESHRKGIEIGHTVVVMASVLNSLPN